MALTVLVCYDISRDAARARVAAYRQQWGDRIQRSVFVCVVAPEEMSEMVSRLEEMIDPQKDAELQGNLVDHGTRSGVGGDDFLDLSGPIQGNAQRRPVVILALGTIESARMASPAYSST